MSAPVQLTLAICTCVFFSSAFHFVIVDSKPRCDHGEQCLPIKSCPEYTYSDRSRTCGSIGGEELVCCNTAVRPSHPPRRAAHASLNSSLPAACGNPNRTLQTSDPNTTALGKWPWMALFGRWNASASGPQLGDWFCSGTLITGRHVLTAAHCLSRTQVNTVGVRIGDYDLSTDTEVQHYERRVARVVLHSQYNRSQNDIALVELAEPVPLTGQLRPLCLPASGAEHPKADVVFTGWGRVSFIGGLPDVLKEVPLTVVDEAACERAYMATASFNRAFPGGFQGTKVCAASRDAVPRGACAGDGGSPLMVVRPDGLYELVGIVSTGIGCGNPKFPDICTKVSRYIEWIVDNLD